MQKIKKRAYLTLVEILIVLTLIGIISTALASNFSGLLGRGKTFATESKMEKIRTAVALYEGQSGKMVNRDSWSRIVRESGLLPEGESPLQDSWGDSFTVEFRPFKISSKNVSD